MRKKLLLLFTIFSISLVSYAAVTTEKTLPSVDDIFKAAAFYYESGEWDNAIEEYESILRSGRVGGNIFYNLGNLYFKKGDLGSAILNYERARCFIPRDSDLVYNYIFAKGRMKQQDMPVTANRLLLSLIRFSDSLTMKEYFLLVLFVYYAIVTLFIFVMHFRNFRFAGWTMATLLTLFLLLQVMPFMFKMKELRQGAVVTKDVTDARFEPVETAGTNFPLYAGMKVYILRAKDDWARVGRPDGQIGWVKKETVSMIKI